MSQTEVAGREFIHAPGRPLVGSEKLFISAGAALGFIAGVTTIAVELTPDNASTPLNCALFVGGPIVGAALATRAVKLWHHFAYKRALSDYTEVLNNDLSWWNTVASHGGSLDISNSEWKR